MSTSTRLLVMFFAAAIVVIAARDIYSRVPRGNKEELQKSAQQFLSELKGDIDVAKASVSSQYLREVAGKPPLEEEKQEKAQGQNQPHPLASSVTEKLKEILSKLLK